MDPGFFSALTASFMYVFTKIADKGIISPAIERAFYPFKEWINKSRLKSQQGKQIEKAWFISIDKTKEYIGEDDKVGRLMAVFKLTGLQKQDYDLIAASVIEMTRNDPAAIPTELLSILDNWDDKKTLAYFLFTLRKQFVEIEDFAKGINYANQLEALDKLEGLSKDIYRISVQITKIEQLEYTLLNERRLTEDDWVAVNGYLKNIRSQLRYVTLPLARAATVELTDAELKMVFVPLNVTPKTVKQAKGISAKIINKEKDRKEKQAGDKGIGASNTSSDTYESEKGRIELDRKYIDRKTIGDVIKAGENFILLGPPGCGKTTLLRQIALSIAEGNTDTIFNWNAGASFPIFFRLRNFGAFLNSQQDTFPSPSPGSIVAYLESFYRNQYRITLTTDFFDKRLAEGHCVVLMDGLDEVGTNQRDKVAQHVNAFIKHYSEFGNRFGLGSRPKGFESVELFIRSSNLTEFEVLPLQPQGIRHLIKNLFLIIDNDPLQRAKDSKGLTDVILKSVELTKIAGTPLFCTALVLVYKYRGAELPQRRVDVFEEIVDLLLGFWRAQQQNLADAGKLGKDDGTGFLHRDLATAVEVKKRRLSHIAYNMQLAEQKAIIPKGEALKLLKGYLEKHERRESSVATNWAESFLYNAHENSGILVEIEPEVYAFTHEGFREYLVACALTNVREKEFIDAILNNILDSSWEEVILQTGAHRSLSDALRVYLLEECLESASKLKDKGQKKSWSRHLFMAGRLSFDMANYIPAYSRELVKTELFNTMTNEATDIDYRVEAGYILDRLDWHPDQLYKFKEVEQTSDNSSFWIGIYPITNSQYQRFIDSDDYKKPEIWTNLLYCNYNDYSHRTLEQEGLDWLNSQKKEDFLPKYWNDPNFGINQKSLPVVGISWFEAMAYCKWLTKNWLTLSEAEENPHLKPNLIRLPNDREWITASGGVEPQNRFPWDLPGEATMEQTEILKRANVQSKLNRPTPLGIYTLGPSYPYGLRDMAGNTWEWQSNHYDNRNKAIAIRGGSFNYSYSNARCASKGWQYADIRDNDLGFRVVVFS